MSCTCRVPRPSPNPRSNDACVRCGRELDDAWRTSDETVSEFFDRLANAQVEDLESFRLHCAQRELAGREEFGYVYLSRNNPVEAMEEAADGALYSYFDTLVARREGDDTPERESWAYLAASHFARAHYALRRLISE